MGIVFTCLYVAMVFKDKKINNIIKNGTESIATYVSSFSKVLVNEQPMYCIKYVYLDKYGKLKEAKSANLYTEKEVKMFENAETFKIKVLDGESVIASKPSELAIQQKNKDKTKIVCEYCGSDNSI